MGCMSTPSLGAFRGLATLTHFSCSAGEKKKLPVRGLFYGALAAFGRLLRAQSTVLITVHCIELSPLFSPLQCN